MQPAAQGWLVGGIAAAAVAGAFLVGPVPQDPAYHDFADRRFLCGTPNFWNVFSNLGFLLVGLYGLARLGRLPAGASRIGYLLFCAGAIGIALGSGYYHFAPDTRTLVWDRLPMTVAFMALFAMVVEDRISPRLGARLLWPLIVAGAGSVLYWYWTELQGRGDLRVYGLVQFLPMVLIPLMLLTAKGRGLVTPLLWGTVGIYALSKAAELLDRGIYDVAGLSGHSIKHLLAAAAMLCAVLAAQRARPSPAA